MLDSTKNIPLGGNVMTFCSFLCCVSITCNRAWHGNPLIHLLVTHLKTAKYTLHECQFTWYMSPAWVPNSFAFLTMNCVSCEACKAVRKSCIALRMCRGGAQPG